MTPTTAASLADVQALAHQIHPRATVRPVTSRVEWVTRPDDGTRLHAVVEGYRVEINGHAIATGATLAEVRAALAKALAQRVVRDADDPLPLP